MDALEAQIDDIAQEVKNQFEVNKAQLERHNVRIYEAMDEKNKVLCSEIEAKVGKQIDIQREQMRRFHELQMKEYSALKDMLLKVVMQRDIEVPPAWLKEVITETPQQRTEAAKGCHPPDLDDGDDEKVSEEKKYIGDAVSFDSYYIPILEAETEIVAFSDSETTPVKYSPEVIQEMGKYTFNSADILDYSDGVTDNCNGKDLFDSQESDVCWGDSSGFHVNIGMRYGDRLDVHTTAIIVTETLEGAGVVDEDYLTLFNENDGFVDCSSANVHSHKGRDIRNGFFSSSALFSLGGSTSMAYVGLETNSHVLRFGGNIKWSESIRCFDPGIFQDSFGRIEHDNNRLATIKLSGKISGNVKKVRNKVVLFNHFAYGSSVVEFGSAEATSESAANSVTSKSLLQSYQIHIPRGDIAEVDDACCFTENVLKQTEMVKVVMWRVSRFFDINGVLKSLRRIMFKWPFEPKPFSISFSQLAEIGKGLDEDECRLLYHLQDSCFLEFEFSCIERVKDQLYLTSFAKDADELQISQHLELQSQNLINELKACSVMKMRRWQQSCDSSKFRQHRCCLKM